MEIKKERLLVTIVLVGILGVLITIFSLYHAAHMGNSMWEYPFFLYGTSVLSLAIGGFVVYLLEEKVSTFQLEKLLSVLPAGEAKVLKLLIERKEVDQNRLVTLSGLSRVKVSRIVSVLEQRKIVEKKKQGYTNLVILKI